MAASTTVGMRGLRLRGPRGWIGTLAVTGVCALAYTALSLLQYAPHTFLRGDSPYYAAAAASIIADGDLEVRNNLKGDLERHSGFVSQGAGGEWRPKHPVLMPVLSVPFLLVLGVPGLLVFNLVVMTLLVAATHRLALRGSGPLPASLAVGVTCLLTFVIAYAYNYSPDAFAALPAVIALILLLDGRPLGAGLAAGVALAAKPVHVLLVGWIVAACWWERGWRGAARALAGVAPLGAAVLVYNTVLFGGPLRTGYDSILQAGPEPTTFSQRGDFSLADLPRNLMGEIADPTHGLLFTAPSVLVALAGLIALWRRRPLLAALPAVLLGGYLLFFATFVDWNASHFGNRYLFVPVLVSALPLGSLFHRRG